MKKLMMVGIIFLLIAPMLLNFFPAASAEGEELVHHTPASPEICQREPMPMPENFTEDYLNTTNPYSDLVSLQGALDEADEVEGDYPLYVLVFADEEERFDRPPEYRKFKGVQYTWQEWATLQIERGDESLATKFGIDIRILGFLEWDSDDSIEYMCDEYGGNDLWHELERDTKYYLRTWYNGEWWQNRVDAVIGITFQETPKDDSSGVSSGPLALDAGRIYVVLKWQVYWKDDNLVQHEVSHLYYPDDHTCPPCCAMSGTKHYWGWIYEDGLWWVFDWILCAFTSYDWCFAEYPDCTSTIHGYKGRYPLRTLIICSNPHGGTYPSAGTYLHPNGASVTVSAWAHSPYVFNYWILDGAIYSYEEQTTVTMNSDHTLEPRFDITVTLTVKVPQAPPEGVKVWIDGSLYYAYADAPVSRALLPGQYTLQVQKGFIKEGEEPDTYYSYTFYIWSDGVGANPRKVNLDHDTSLTANYMRSKYGIASEQPDD